MSPGFTAQAARNIFYGGTLFFVLVFAALILHTETRIPERSVGRNHTGRRARQTHLETRNCMAATPAG